MKKRVLAGVVGLVVASNGQALPYQFQSLEPPGSSHSYAWSINDSRETVVTGMTGSVVYRPGATHGQPAGYSPIGVPQGFSSFTALEINNKGQVSGWVRDSTWYWLALWLPEPDYARPAGMAISAQKNQSGPFPAHLNNKGQVVVSPDYDLHYLWLPTADYGRTAGIHQLPISPEGLSSEDNVRALNDNGVLAGRVHANRIAVFLMQPQPEFSGTGVVDLADATTPGETWAVGSSNQLLLHYTDVDGSSVYSLWMPVDANGLASGEYIIARGRTDIYLHGMNDRGQVIGWINQSPFLWEPLKGIRMFDQLVTIPSGANFLYPTDINNNGDIVGYYTDNGTKHHAFALIVPEPAGIASVGITVLLSRRKGAGFGRRGQ
jgi:hypothetical protein